MKFCKKCGGFFEEEQLTCPDDGGELTVLHRNEEDAHDPLVGAVLDRRYRVLARLGQGGMGSVYRALQTSTRREVALKVIRGELSDDGIRRFMMEAHTTSALGNIHTVTIFDFGQTEEGVLYLAMELLAGHPLQAIVDRERPLDWRRALHIVDQIAESLAEAHDKGIVHRDLKPANIILTRMGNDPDFVKVLDFGIAKLQRGGLTTNLTGTGMILGTPCYMSPEQARGEDLDARSDLYSLGIVLFEMLVGEPPFFSEQPLSLLMKHCQDPVPRLAARRPGLVAPGEVQVLVDTLLAKDKDERFQTAEALRERIAELLAGAVQPGPSSSAGATPEPARGSSPSSGQMVGERAFGPLVGEGLSTDALARRLAPPPRQMIVIAALALLLLGGGALLVWWGGGGQDARSSAALSAGSGVVVAEATASSPAEPAATAAGPVGGAAPTGAAGALPVAGGSASGNVAVASVAAPAPAPPTPASPRTIHITVADPETGEATVLDEHGTRLGSTPLELPAPTNTPRTLTLKRQGAAETRLRLVPEEAPPPPVRLEPLPAPTPRKLRRPRPAPPAKPQPSLPADLLPPE